MYIYRKDNAYLLKEVRKYAFFFVFLLVFSLKMNNFAARKLVTNINKYGRNNGSEGARPSCRTLLR